MLRRLALGVWLVAFAGPAWAKPDLVAAVPAAIRRGGVQTDLPTPKQPYFWNFTIPPELLEILLWGGVALGVVVIALAMRDSLPALNRSRRFGGEPGASAASSAADPLGAAQVEADELAARGAFAEAMHVLLLRALAELRERLRIAFADSLTSREILRRAPLDASARQAFARIIGDVELTHFGDAPAGGEDYARCRLQFDILRRSLAAVGPA